MQSSHRVRGMNVVEMEILVKAIFVVKRTTTQRFVPSGTLIEYVVIFLIVTRIAVHAKVAIFVGIKDIVAVKSQKKNAKQEVRTIPVIRFKRDSVLTILK